MEILTTKVPRALEIKWKIFGFELGHFIIVFMYLSISNLIFGTTALKGPIVWGGTFLVAIVLYFATKNKPDQFIQHYAQFHLAPSVLQAGEPDLEFNPYKRGENEKSQS